MKITCPVNKDAAEQLPGKVPDGSGIAVHYIDNFIKPLNGEQEGVKFACKRRGLKLTLTVGDKKGEGIVRRIENGPEFENMLLKCLEEAAESAGLKISVGDEEITIED